MQIVIAGNDPTDLAEYLRKEGGHEVKAFYVNNICRDIARAYSPDVFIYMEDVAAAISHEQALKQIKDCHLFIIAARDSPIVPFAAALGIKDFVFQPCELSAILNRIEHPASPEEAADMLANTGQPRHKSIVHQDTQASPGKLHPQKREAPATDNSKIKPGTYAGIVIIKPDEFNPDHIKKGIIVDADGQYSQMLEQANPKLWKSDWRLGFGRAQAHYLQKETLLYSQTKMLGPVDERDQSRFSEFIEVLPKKHKKIYVIAGGRWLQELLRPGVGEGGI